MARSDEATRRWIENEVLGDTGISTITDSDDGTTYDVGDALSEIVDSGTIEIDSSGGADSAVSNVSGANQTDTLEISAWVDSNASNLASGTFVAPTYDARADSINVQFQYDHDGNGWEVRVQSNNGLTTGPVNIGWEVRRY